MSHTVTTSADLMPAQAAPAPSIPGLIVVEHFGPLAQVLPLLLVEVA